MDAETSIGEDVLEGASEIAEFIWGTGTSRKRAYNAVHRGLPAWRIGARIYARKSAIVDWISRQESKGRNR